LGAAEHFCKGRQVDAKGDVAVASKGRKGGGGEEHADEGDVRVVHGLQSNAGVVAVEIAILD